MKGEFKTGLKGIRIRNSMLIVQYVLSFLLTICTLLSYKQINHFLTADVGFEKENILVIENAEYIKNTTEFVNSLKNLEGVVGSALCEGTPFMVYNGDQFVPDMPNAGGIPINYALADEDYLPLLNVKMLVGRGFDEEFATDTAGVVINEMAAKSIGWKVNESILNKRLKREDEVYKIIGVVKNFNFWSLHTPIEPFGIFHKESSLKYGPLSNVIVKMKGDESQLLAAQNLVLEEWKQFQPNIEMVSFLLNQQFESAYEGDKQFGKLLSLFAILTIVIASLGLLGIVVFSLEQKIKEIGVRKVLGASMLHIVILFTKNYFKLLLIGFTISIPIVYYLMEKWLADYEYRIKVGPVEFFIALFILTFISLTIATFYSIRASLINPAKILKDE